MESSVSILSVPAGRYGVRSALTRGSVDDIYRRVRDPGTGCRSTIVQQFTSPNIGVGKEGL